jgi:hypothetical protein
MPPKIILLLFLGATLAPLEASPAASSAPQLATSSLAVSLAPTTPAFSWFAVDSLGRGQNLDNVVLTEKLPTNHCFLETGAGKNTFLYSQSLTNGQMAPVWRLEVSERRMRLESKYVEGLHAPPFVLLIDQRKNHATLLGNLLPGERRVSLPCVLHLPDHGTFRITATRPDAALDYDARRRRPENFVRIEFRPATKDQRTVEYTVDVTLIYPHLAGLDENPLYDGYRRNFLNLLQLQPRLRTLANNSSSDACGFCFWEYSELAQQAPPLAPGLTALDLVRQSVDRVLDGGLTYGQTGYKRSQEYPDAAPWSPPNDSLDTLPSLLIAACQYIQGSKDKQWANARYTRLAAMARQMLAQDIDGNGLIEYVLSGNSGSWAGISNRVRPANWWDTIGFGHEDAFSNALAYRACELMEQVGRFVGRTQDADEFGAAARKIKKSYYATFFNPQTGVLAGWKSADGKLHDYWFTFINGMAVSFGLVEGSEANGVMDHLLAKMRDVGYSRFDLGLPGNLVPVRKEDYLEGSRRYGSPTNADGSDAFQIYENGAATACHAYWTVKALYRLGRPQDARRIYYPMLKAFAEGSFQGFDSSGKLSKDWRDWRGGCNGYEGYLSDGYLALLAVEDDLRASTARTGPAKPGEE